MNKKLIRLTESDLHRIVKESVNKILSEAINELDPEHMQVTLINVEHKGKMIKHSKAHKQQLMLGIRNTVIIITVMGVKAVWVWMIMATTILMI